MASQSDDRPQQPAPASLDTRDLKHMLQTKGFKVRTIRGVIVCRHRLRVAVDQNRLHAALGQGVDRVAAAVVELDPLADAVGPRTEDDHFVAVLRGGFAQALIA